MSSQRDYYEFMGYSSDELRARYAPYADRFAGGGTVVDIGCGRGEFLELLAGRGVAGVGIDLDAEMVEEVRRKGLDARQAAAVDFLGGHERSFDGVFAAHLIEHLPADAVVDLIAVAARSLKEGGRLLVVTPNPHSLGMQLYEFWTDLQHVRFYTPEIVRWAFHRAGLSELETGENELYLTGRPRFDEMPPSVAPAPAGGKRRLRDRARSRFGRLAVPSLVQRIQELEERADRLARGQQQLLDSVLGLFPPSEYFVTGVARVGAPD